jgi:SAM-dependent methyltransferase
MTSAVYVGSELELFAEARRWKDYLRRKVAPYLGDEVLEVGAGMGAFARAAARHARRRWVCVEPDPALQSQIARSIAAGELPASCEARLGGIEAVADGEVFDSILYVDVLEHIEDDGAEVRRAFERLRPGGCLVVLAPAHPFLYTAFDKSIGHYRRYTKDALRLLTPPRSSLEVLSYLDSAGMLASLGNRLLLRKAMPSRRQIAFWDGVLVPISRVLDPLLLHGVGKSLLAVWRK